MRCCVEGRLSKRDADFARLRMLNPKLAGETMSHEEAQAVATHLKQSAPVICQAVSVLKGSRVTHIKEVCSRVLCRSDPGVGVGGVFRWNTLWG